MPLELIRNDITKVSADAIVNTANPDVTIGYGTDRAIYEAAGARSLLEERSKIGKIKPGDAAVTPAFALDAKYVIHTVGPVWRGGSHGETETVAKCYRKCLALAADLECETVAFPLISSGTYGFPKDVALKTAISEISSFLFSHDMTVYLVVYDKESFVVSGKAFSDIRSYIEDGDVKEQRHMQNRPIPGVSRMRQRFFGRKDAEGSVSDEQSCKPEETGYSSSFAESDITYDEYEEDMCVGKAAPEIFEYSAPQYTAPQYSYAPSMGPIEAVIGNKEETFQQMLLRMIDSKGYTDPEVYKRANVDRKLFSKIRGDIDYKPSKKTAVAFAIALALNLDETTDLLRKAGLALSPSYTFDLIIKYCIVNGIYNIHEVNCLLFEFDQMTLGGLAG